MITFNTENIADQQDRENAEKLTTEFKNNPFLSGEWKVFEYESLGANSEVKIKHNLSFVPTDIILTYIEGNYNFYFRYDLTDKDYIYAVSAGDCFVRFIAGKLGTTL